MSNLTRGRVTGLGSTEPTPIEESSRQFMSRHWRAADACCSSGKTDDFFSRLLTHYLTVTGMPFQDVWNVDIERLRGCCGHVVTPDRRIIPFCSYYLTSADGTRLY